MAARSPSRGSPQPGGQRVGGEPPATWRAVSRAWATPASCVLALGQGPARVEGFAAVLVDDLFQVGECAGQRRRRGVDGLAEQGDGIGREQQDADHQGDVAADQRVEEPLDVRGFASPGGATLDNKENYLLKKLFTALGAIQIENRARI
jgi:hypothetical protein